jgi:hypothetical protein
LISPLSRPVYQHDSFVPPHTPILLISTPSGLLNSIPPPALIPTPALCSPTENPDEVEIQGANFFPAPAVDDPVGLIGESTGDSDEYIEVDRGSFFLTPRSRSTISDPTPRSILCLCPKSIEVWIIPDVPLWIVRTLDPGANPRDKMLDCSSSS